MKKIFAIALPLLFLGTSCNFGRPNEISPPTTVCTMEAKLCPDGSAVGRTGPNCEFAKCPVTTNTAPLYKRVTIRYVTISPLEVLSDSRCPEDVQCVWAGTVKLKALLVWDTLAETVTLTLGAPVKFNGQLVTLTNVMPTKNSKTTLTASDYQFTFSVVPQSVAASGTLTGHMTIGPICPVERVDQPCKPTLEMYAAHKIYVYTEDKTSVVTTITPDVNGNFSASLPVGNYYVDTVRPGIGSVSGLPMTVSIKAGITENLQIDIDTGIR